MNNPDIRDTSFPTNTISTGACLLHCKFNKNFLRSTVTYWPHTLERRNNYPD